MPPFCWFIFLVVVAMLELSDCKPPNGKKSDYENILQTSKRQCTEKSLKENEGKMVKLIGFGPRGRPYPDSIEAFTPYCKETSRLSRELETYSRDCFRKEIHNILTIFLYSVRSSQTRPFCGRNIRKNAARVRDAACLNKHFFSQDKCFEVFNNATAKLVNWKDDKVKMPFTCCNFNRLLKCMEALLDSRSCTIAHRENFLGIIKGATAGLIDVVCGEYSDETDRCDTIGPQPSAPNPKTYRSFFLALMDLLASTSGFND